METKQLLAELTQKLADSKIIFQVIDQDCYLIYSEWKVKVENGTETKTGRTIKTKIGNLSFTPEFYQKKWMEELTESLKEPQPSTSTSGTAFVNIPESKETKNSSRPNEHRAWFVDQTVIDFLWKKGWNCCQAETCDWWYNTNQHLKKEFFTSESEWKDFKEKGLYPAKHQSNWAQLSMEDQTEIKKHCWDSSRQQYHSEQLMAFTLSKLKQSEKMPKKNNQK